MAPEYFDESQDGTEGWSVLEETLHLFFVYQVVDIEVLPLIQRLDDPAVLEKLDAAVEAVSGLGELELSRYPVAAGGLRGRAGFHGRDRPRRGLSGARRAQALAAYEGGHKEQD